ncbi:11555_t:CDS:2 [Funneliformis caledonium]|uniref:11555_t:CDS:1 n=1 Tax=Funneliformis caledonium TaxID=1117310 RepID=A0A9N9HXL1_9GLOM|nr:11555_t:CDS:2 [Funneliformis caledonium]
MSDLRRQSFSGDRYEDYVKYIRMHYIKNGEIPTELSIGERHEYNALEDKFTIEKSRNASFNGKCDYMEIEQMTPSDKWVVFHKYDLQMKNPFGKFCRGLVNITRRIGHIRQKHVFLNALRQKEFYQIVNNAQEMHPPCINRQRSASASSFIDVDEYWASVQKNARKG